MIVSQRKFSAASLRQQEIRGRCYHPAGSYVEFSEEEVNGSLSERFARQVALYADRTAFTDETHTLTYRDLSQAANRIAHAIHAELGEDEESIVVLMDQGRASITAFLGILKAGKCHVAVSPQLPFERQQLMVAQSEAGMILTERDHRQLAGKLAGARLHVLDVDKDTDGRADQNPALMIQPDRRCWIVYTSGSTGQPKGVVQTHRNVLHDMRTYVNAFHISFQDRLSLLMSLTTNAGCFCTLMALVSGAALCRIDVRNRGVDHMASEVARQRLTIWGGVPSLFRQWMATSEQTYPQLRLVWLGGETAHARDLELYQQKLLPPCIFVNRLGSTETGCTRIYFADHQTQISGSTVPVGYPVHERDIVLQDAGGYLVDAPGSGEIVVRSCFLSPGYWRRPDLTQAAYACSEDDAGSRLFFTGDLGQMDADGCLSYLGRKDFQVQVRGYRVEVAEVESQLDQLRDVRESAVVGQALPEGGQRLVAYVVPAKRPAAGISAMRQELADRLPDYMVPSRFVYLDSLPRAANGKVVRSQLPPPDDARPELGTRYVSPRNLLEEQLASVWCEVLDFQTVGIHDNFFALGGDSLLAARVKVRMVAEMQVDLPLRMLFESPTIAEISKEIRRLRSDGLTSGGPVLRRIDRTQLRQLPLSFAQQRLWFLDQLTEGALTAYNIPFAWRLRGSLRTEVLRQALEEIIRRHEPLRTTFQIAADGPVQRIGMIERFDLFVEDLRGLAPDKQPAEVIRHCQLEAERPFDLSSDLMLRATLLRLTDDEHVLLLTMHHIASDRWSVGVLFDELARLYAAFTTGRPSPLPDLPVSYADYAVWHRNNLNGPRLEKLLQYWCRQLDGLSPLELPTDRPRPPFLTHRGATYDFDLAEPVVDQLKWLSQAEGATLHMTLLAAFQTLLAKYSGQDDIVVGTPIAGRNHPELEDLIGFFVNTLALRTELSADLPFRNLLGRVRQASLDAYDHQDLPFEKVVEGLQPERRLNRNPLVQATLHLITFAEKPLVLCDVEVSRLQFTHQSVRFDLEMQLWRRARHLDGRISYSADLFNRATIERIAAEFETLVAEIAAEPDRRIGQLPLSTDRSA